MAAQPPHGTSLAQHNLSGTGGAPRDAQIARPPRAGGYAERVIQRRAGLRLLGG